MTVADVLGEGLGPAVFEVIDAHLDGRAEVRVARTQVGWASRRGFAFLWCPRRWLGATVAPLVLTVAFTEPVASHRWKQINEVRPGMWNHHLEIGDVGEVDDEVLGWVDRAWREAG